jgi:hypothetical protein
MSKTVKKLVYSFYPVSVSFGNYFEKGSRNWLTLPDFFKRSCIFNVFFTRDIFLSKKSLRRDGNIKTKKSDKNVRFFFKKNACFYPFKFFYQIPGKNSRSCENPLKPSKTSSVRSENVELSVWKRKSSL